MVEASVAVPSVTAAVLTSVVANSVEVVLDPSVAGVSVGLLGIPELVASVVLYSDEDEEELLLKVPGAMVLEACVTSSD